MLSWHNWILHVAMCACGSDMCAIKSLGATTKIIQYEHLQNACKINSKAIMVTNKVYTKKNYSYMHVHIFMLYFFLLLAEWFFCHADNTSQYNYSVS